MVLPNRWRVVVIRPDGSVGSSFYCVNAAQRSIVCLALAAAHLSFSVEEYSV